MRTLGLIVAVLCAAQSAIPSHAAERTLEAQFRIDCEAIVRRTWGAKPPDRANDVKREVDQLIEGLRSFRPSFLQADEKVPSDIELQIRWEKLVALEGGSPERTSPMWQYYVPLWKERKLNQAQKVIFSRMVALLTDEHEERKKERERRKG